MGLDFRPIGASVQNGTHGDLILQLTVPAAGLGKIKGVPDYGFYGHVESSSKSDALRSVSTTVPLGR